jgi:hypothetical protein
MNQIAVADQTAAGRSRGFPSVAISEEGSPR